MNSEKILIEINVAGVNRSFDCIVPRTLPAKLLCRGFLELVEQSMGIPFGAYRQALLMSERTGRILSPDARRRRYRQRRHAVSGLRRVFRAEIYRSSRQVYRSSSFHPKPGSLC